MYYLGIDLGQRNDPTALALIRDLCVVGLERVPLGTPYPVVIDRLRRLTNTLHKVRIAVDATGVGAPVVEAMRRAGLNAEVSAVTITGGDRETHRGLDYHVPKQDLMTGLHLLLERGELKISSRLPDARSLVKELIDMRAVARPGGRAKIAADRFGEHDDLAMALALAVWRAKQKFNGMGTTRLPGI